MAGRGRDWRGHDVLIDAHSVEPGTQIEADLCVIGSGAAGLTIAQQLNRSRIQVVVLESGGLEPDPEVQLLAAGTLSGRPYFDLETARLRFFGGTTNHWGGRCMPLTGFDLAKRDWIPHSGWPITLDELMPYYRRAQEIIGLGPFEYDIDAVAAELGEALFPFAKGVLRTVMTRAHAQRFGPVYQEEMAASANIRVVLNATVQRLDATESTGMVERAEVATLAGTRFTVRARRYVVACGGIDNARLLLLSNRQAPRGLGNQHDNVGRFFMEHLFYSGGLLAIGDADAEYRLYAGIEQAGDILLQGMLGFDADFLTRERLPNLYFELDDVRGYGFSDGFHEMSSIAKALGDLHWPSGFFRRIGRIAGDADVIVDGIADSIFGAPLVNERPPLGFRMRTLSEQLPNPDSRVTLGTQKDAFGLPLADLAWRTTDADIDGIHRAFAIVAREAGRSGLGRVRIDPVPDEAVPLSSMRGGYHHMGTTRMSRDPRDGVVDADCRVHGVENLYMAGSSVFPTSGYGNPTFAIVALAVRLADHLRKGLG